MPDEGKVEKTIAPIFKATMDQELGIETRIATMANVQRKGSNSTQGGYYRAVMIMFTADADDGGALQKKMHDHSEDLQKAIEADMNAKRIPWLHKGTVTAWVKSTLDYYGPRVSNLPDGKRLTQRIGQKPGQESANGSPAFAV